MFAVQNLAPKHVFVQIEPSKNIEKYTKYADIKPSEPLNNKAKLNIHEKSKLGSITINPPKKTSTNISHTSTVVDSSVNNDLFNPFSKSSKLDIIGRDTERSFLQSKFVSLSVDKIGGGLYISGNPGTGKTACVTSVIESNKTLFKEKKISTLTLNCMTINNAKQLYQIIYDHFIADSGKKLCSNEINYTNDTEFVVKTKLESIFLNRSNTKRGFILILDELDHLINFNVKLLYSFFEWALAKNSCLYLIGIANALDLTETLVPRLKARGYFPELIHFKPYSVQEILGVLKKRSDILAEMSKNLSNNSQSESEKNDVINSLRMSSLCSSIMVPALELCARKVAASSGDLRKALDACRMAVESTRSRAMKSIQSGQPLTQNKVSVGDMMKVLSSMYGTSTEKMLNNLNFHQKIVLVSVHNFMSYHRKLSMNNHNSANHSNDPFIDDQGSFNISKTSTTKRNSSPSVQHLTINTLYEIYLDICKTAGLPGYLTRCEFNDLVSMMESIGVLEIQNPSKSTKNTPSRLSTSAKFISSTKSNIANGENRVFISVSLDDVKRCISSLPTLSSLIKN
ncbi:Cell division control protein 18 [Smittium culicis]|uniref:Cell division control protein n=1 Tax=Smittium culicis TaxID=133412 RepID=A0A1R1Y9G6_9FUNG|nr:Cell division control protein 18 [Smittium culicis]